MVGGRDFDDSKFDRATQALRQPGSTFKPIVYADAIQNGRPPSYMVDDSPLEVPQPDSTTWAPQNYDGTFQGVMTMRRGLYLSRNLVAIRVGMELGTGKRDRRGPAIRHHDADPSLSVDLHRLGGRLSAGADLGIHRVRHARLA